MLMANKWCLTYKQIIGNRISDARIKSIVEIDLVVILTRHRGYNKGGIFDNFTICRPKNKKSTTHQRLLMYLRSIRKKIHHYYCHQVMGTLSKCFLTIGPHKFFVVPPYFNATIYLTLEREPTALHYKYYIDLSL